MDLFGGNIAAPGLEAVNLASEQLVLLSALVQPDCLFSQCILKLRLTCIGKLQLSR